MQVKLIEKDKEPQREINCHRYHCCCVGRWPLDVVPSVRLEFFEFCLLSEDGHVLIHFAVQIYLI